MQVHRSWTILAVWAVAHAQTARFATYRDATYGVTFQYPARWTINPQLGWYLGTDILHVFARGFDVPEAITKVGFESTEVRAYADTDLDGVEFVYYVAPHMTENACYGRLRTSLGNTVRSEPSTVVIHGTTYLHFENLDGGLGHAAKRDIYAASVVDRCYLFEAGIHSELGSEKKPLRKTQTDLLRRQLNRVMRSVEIVAPTAH
jgi:hypothetical protein